ncbi:MAG TPA: ATP-binding protein [Solirubrobacteraceae bacterium]|nr:ATP-binding protein [Solirubrobacteraceae bacterium]
MTEDFPAVRLELDSRPEAPAIIRAALAGVAQLLEFDPELFDDLKTAISEACNNVVLYAYEGTRGPLVAGLEIRPGAVFATIRDWGGGIQHVGPSDERMGVGLAVISALADRAEFIRAPGGGTEVRMVFTGRGDATVELGDPAEAARDSGVPAPLSGDVVVTVSPSGLLAGVLGRVVRAVAARTHLSLDRFSDLYLATDAIAAFAPSAASGSAVTFAVAGGHERLELTVGPFRPGASEQLRRDGLPDVLGELTVEEGDGSELLRLVVEERREASGR